MSDDAVSALATQTGLAQQKLSLSSFKKNQEVELQVATMASRTVPSNPGLGKVVDTNA